MAVTAQTRQRLTEIAALVSANLVSHAFDEMNKLILALPATELLLASPDIRIEIERFQNKKRRDLHSVLKGRSDRLSSSDRPSGQSVRNPLSGMAETESLNKRVAFLLRRLADSHIFQWTPHYRDTMQFVFAIALPALKAADQFEEEMRKVGAEIAAHAHDIFSRGYAFTTDRGLATDAAESKSVGGLQRFIDLAVLIYLELRLQVATAQDAELLWALVSTWISSILRGYSLVNFGGRSGWTLLGESPRIWVSPIGFCRGTELQSLFEDVPTDLPDRDLFVAITASALAIERFAHSFHGDDVLLPRLSRVSPGYPPRLDVTLSAKRATLSRDLLVSCFWQDIVDSENAIVAAELLGATAIVGRLDPSIQAWAEQNAPAVVDVSGVEADQQHIHHLSERIGGKLESQGLSTVGNEDPGVMMENFASGFPLDDPDLRRQFMVERHSVKKLLQLVEGSSGIQLWCSVRRSGKTTAALELADASGRFAVVMQTMDHLLREPTQNIFSRRISEAFAERKELKPDFFAQLVKECILAGPASETLGRRTVFIVDEYESLFGLIDSYVQEDVGLKVRVALPLMSQMVDFGTRNLLIFMGQRPDAYQIIPSQNQLSPLVTQHGFPLFAHVHGAPKTEFTQFLSRILSDQLAFDASFATSVYEETSGHPYLTVNLMVDFCDWLISTRHRLDSGALSAMHFGNFSKDRLTPAKLKRSPYYEFFHSQMADYLSERSRIQEPWLAAIAHLLRTLALRPRSSYSCPVAAFEQSAAPLGANAQMPASRLIRTGCQANFFQDKDGLITPGVKLLARLAGASTPTMN
jgi:hypothetical protein